MTDDPTRCSAWARTHGIDPIASMGTYQGFLLVEVPLPWPRDVAEVPEIASLAPVLAGRNLRVQALVPADPASRRVVAYVNPTPSYLYATTLTSPDEPLAPAVSSLLDSSPSPASGRDLLICTHGKRDVCCGSLGTELALLASGLDLPADVSLWRTSHTGGHRFAPTFIVLPEGTAWAYADADLLTRVLRRSGDVADVADHYRGCAGLSAPQLQALEREVLRRVGWTLLDRPRAGTVVGPVATMEVSNSDGGIERWEARVTPGRTVPVPDCMRPVSEARKTETEWVVGELSVA